MITTNYTCGSCGHRWITTVQDGTTEPENKDKTAEICVVCDPALKIEVEEQEP